MSFNFVIPEFNINGAGTPPLLFFRRGFNLGTSGSGPSWQDIILHGNTALTLVNAKANGLNYLKLFGKCEQRNLPEGHTQLEYVYMTEGSCIRIEDLLISSGYRVEFDFQTTTLNSSLRNYIGGRANGVSAGGGFRLSKLASSNNNRVVLYGFEAGTEYYDPTVQFQANTRYKFTYNNGVCTLETGGNVVSTKTFTVTDNTSTKWGINDYLGNGSWSAYHDPIYVHSVKVWNTQGELVMDLVPDKTSSDVVCLYDMATDTLRTATQGTFEAGPTAVPTPSVPIDIVCNNGVIKFGKRLTLDSARYYSYIYTDNTWKYSNDSYCIVIPVSVGHKYKITVPTTNPLNNKQNTIFRYGFADTINEDWKNDNLTGQTSIPIYDYVRTTPQDLPSVEVAATHPYLVIQMGAAVFSYILTNNLITVIDQTTYTDGTVETVEVTGKNLFNKNNLPERIYAYFASSGTTWAYVSSGYSLRFPCLPNTTYTVRYNGNSTQTVLSFASTSNDDVPTSDNQLITVTQAIRQNSPTINTPITLTTGANDKWLIVQYNVADPQNADMTDNLQLELGSTATTYEPYYYGGQATAEMLLKVGDYQDIQSVLNGEVTRNVGVKVLDGTEPWVYQSGASAYISLDDAKANSIGVCTHLIGDNSADAGTIRFTSVIRVYGIGSFWVNLAEFKQWLKDQYNAGTPVIVIYPLATPTTETVDSQELTIQQGTNIVEITQASMDNLELEVSYKAGVAVTITEVQNANLSNQVTVTIGG